MHSNKIGAFFFFVFIILCFAPLISADGSQLRKNYYDKSCRDLVKTASGILDKEAKTNPRILASLLRLHFHDCFVLGCDASLLLDDKDGEQLALPNLNSILGLNVIDKIKTALEIKCRGIVSCADILALVAGLAVQKSLWLETFDVSKNPGSSYLPVEFGRLDGLKSDKNKANKEIPGPTEPISSIIKKFSAKGLSIQDMVALSGAHTIGMTKCSTFKNRLYFPNRTRNVNEQSFQLLKQTCHNDASTDNKTVFLDNQSHVKFDNLYYGNIMNKGAVLESDQALGSDRNTKGLVEKYNNDQNAFFDDFTTAMLKMGRIGVHTTGETGEIRKECGKKNNN